MFLRYYDSVASNLGFKVFKLLGLTIQHLVHDAIFMNFLLCGMFDYVTWMMGFLPARGRRN